LTKELTLENRNCYHALLPHLLFFGALTYTTSPPTGLLGVGLGGDSTPRMIAFQLRLEF
jgi:hypothetical protein